MIQPNLKSMTLHFDNKHPKIPYAQPGPEETVSKKAKYDAEFSAKKATATANDPKRIKGGSKVGKGKGSKDPYGGGGGQAKGTKPGEKKKKKKKGLNDLSALDDTLNGC